MGKVKKYKLECEIDHDYFLIGIHSVLEDFRLAYLLNSEFNINLKRVSKNIEFSKKEGSFSNFDFEDQASFCYWSLISNKFVEEQEVSKNQLSIFEQISNTYVLISEKKNTDYFLKIEGDFTNEEIQNITKKINSIHRVMTTYEMDPETLKSKDFLIF